MGSIIRWRPFVCLLACAWLAACGGTTDGGEEVAAPSPPPRVDASQGDFRDAVVVAWEAVPNATSYLVFRDGEQIGDMDSNGEDTMTFDDPDADAGSAFSAPVQVNARYVEGGVQVSWAPGTSQPGTTHSYTIVSVNEGGQSEPSPSAEGYRSSAEVGRYEVQVDGSGDWGDAGDDGNWIDQNAALPFLVLGDVSATDGSMHAGVELDADAPEVQFGPARSYSVRAVTLSGQTSEPSAEASPVQDVDSLTTEWERTDVADAVANYATIEADCARELTCIDDSPAPNDAVRYYRLDIVAAIDDLMLQGKSETDAGAAYECDVNGDPFGGGDGTESTPWRICTGEQLSNVNAERRAEHFVLATSIDMTDESVTYEPVRQFFGTFDGRGNAIENFTFTLEESNANQQMAFFGRLGSGSRVSNLRMVGVDIRVEAESAALAGSNAGHIENVSVEGDVAYANDIYYNSNLSSANIGGLVVENEEGGVIERSESHVDVNAELCCVSSGGLAAQNKGLIVDSLATGTVSGGSTSGGLVGWCTGGRIETSKATGRVESSSRAGGLVGVLKFDTGIWDSYATGTVEATANTTQAGGLVGQGDAVAQRSYATGQVIASSENAGGLIGTTDNNLRGFTDTYWDLDTTGMSTSAGGTGLETSEFADVSNFPGWRFVPINEAAWKMGTDADGNARPVLYWE